jgi:hypothetical protein
VGAQAVDLGRPAKELTGAREHALRLSQRTAAGQVVGRWGSLPHVGAAATRSRGSSACRSGAAR